MHIAILTFDGFNELDSLIALGILNRVRRDDWRVSIASPTATVTSMNGVVLRSQTTLAEATTADAVIVGSGVKTREVVRDVGLMEALRLDPSRQLVGAQCSGALVLAALGLLDGVPACTDLTTKPWVQEAGVEVLEQPFFARGNVATARRVPRRPVPRGVGDRPSRRCRGRRGRNALRGTGGGEGPLRRAGLGEHPPVRLMPDPIFALRRLAEIYDSLEGDRDDLDAYAAIVAEHGARSVLDVGCGTGAFACRLAALGIDVVAVDPAAASLEVAARKEGAERVRWVLGDATTLPPLQVDLAVMTGNVAQVFIDDAEWMATLCAVREALSPGGVFVFEVRDPSRAAFTEWNRNDSFERVDLAGVGPVQHWVDVTAVDGGLVAFTWTFHFERSAETVTSDSVLRFRSRADIEESLRQAGFEVREVRDAARPPRSRVRLPCRPSPR